MGFHHRDFARGESVRFGSAAKLGDLCDRRVHGRTIGKSYRCLMGWKCQDSSFSPCDRRLKVALARGRLYLVRRTPCLIAADSNSALLAVADLSNSPGHRQKDEPGRSEATHARGFNAIPLS